MEGKAKQKRKGGAEKIRENKRKCLGESAKTCVKLTSVFSKQPTKPSSSVQELDSNSNSHGTDINAPEEVTHSDQENILQKSQLTCEHADTVTEEVPTKTLGENPVSLNAKTASNENISPQNDQGDQSVEEPIRTLEDDDSAAWNENDSKTESERPVSEYFQRPKQEDFSLFFKFHPKQNTTDPILQKAFLRDNGSNRHWLTYDDENDKFYCSACLAFSKMSDSSVFMTGFTDRKHIHQRVQSHETSELHQRCAQAFLLNTKELTVDRLLFENQMTVRQEQVKIRREVMERIIDVVKLIGKRGLSYRANIESAYTLADSSVDHGNFLEIIMLLKKYDARLGNYIDECIEKSQAQHSKSDKPGPKGRGSLVTFISKNTVDYILHAIKNLIQMKIAEDVIKAGMYSIQIDTTQDASGKDQCSIIIRYVTDKVHERLLEMYHSTSGSGENLCKLVVKVLRNCKIDVKKCIGNSTDGAPNMNGQYEGFNAWLNKESPLQFHVWCYGHNLNLVIGDTSSITVEAASFFSLLNDTGVFIRDSYLRCDIWEAVSKDPRHRRIGKLGATRWWSKSVSTKKVFGYFDENEKKKYEPLYVEILVTLEKILEETTLTPDARAKARGYIDCLLKFETILTAHVFMRIFEVTTILSDTLQKRGLDVLKAYQMVRRTQKTLEGYGRDFNSVLTKASQFVHVMNEKLKALGYEHLEIEETLPAKRTRRKKLMSGEQAPDEVISDPIKNFEVNVYNVILDKANESMKSRFNKNELLFADISILHPRNFPELKNDARKIQAPMFDDLSTFLLKFSKDATPDNLRHEFRTFVSNWDILKTSVAEFYESLRVSLSENIDADNDSSNDDTDFDNTAEDNFFDNDDIDDDADLSLNKISCTACKKCPVCCYLVLRQYNMMATTYQNLGLAYQYILTLSCTQVACEWSFSILKYIKNRLRSSLGQENLQAFMLMACEKDITVNLSPDEIIDEFSKKSPLMKKLLIF